MSEAGQNTVTGISKQADVALLYLLEKHQYHNFIKITVEGSGWEDFTLFYSEKIESYEVKWKKQFSYADILKIIQKEISKKNNENRFVVVCKYLGESFKKEYEMIKKYSVVAEKPEWFDDYKQYFQKFIDKEWNKDEIIFLLKMDLREIGGDDQLEKLIYDRFIYYDNTYLSQYDIKLVISDSFRTIMKKAESGGSISKEEFFYALNEFKYNQSEKSQDFPPSIDLGDKYDNIKKYLDCPTNFKKLDHHKFLTPISMNSRLVYYVVKQILKNKISLKDSAFFVEKVLSKKGLLLMAMNLFEEHIKNNSFDIDTFLKFSENNYPLIQDDLSAYGLFKVFYLYVSKVPNQEECEKIFSFLTSELLQQKLRKDRYESYSDNYEVKYEYLIKCLNKLNEITKNDDEYFEQLFDYFDFVGNDWGIRTSKSYYLDWACEYLTKDLQGRYRKLINLTSSQLSKEYGRKFDGYEFISFFEGINSELNYNDLDIVKQVLKPAFKSCYINKPKETMSFFYDQVFISSVDKISSIHPAFALRSAVPFVVDAIINNNDDNGECIEQLKIMIGCKDLNLQCEVFFQLLDKEFDENLSVMNLNLPELIDLAMLNPNAFCQGIICKILMKNIDKNKKTAFDFLSVILKDKSFVGSIFFENIISSIINRKYIPKSIEDADILLSLIINYELDDNQKIKCSELIANFANAFDMDLEFSRKIILENVSFLDKKNRTIFIGKVITYMARLNAKLTHIVFEHVIKDTLIGEEKLLNVPLIELGLKLVQEKEYSQSLELVNSFMSNDSFLEESFNLLFAKDQEIILGNIVEPPYSELGEIIRILESLSNTKDPAVISEIMKVAYILTDMKNSTKNLENNKIPLSILMQCYYLMAAVVNNVDGKQYKEIKNSTFIGLKLCLELKKSGYNPKGLVFGLLRVFDKIRNLSQEEALDVLNLFEIYDIKESAGLFVYFCFLDVQKYTNKHIFKEKLISVSKSNSELKDGLARSLYQLTTNSKDIHDFQKVDEYWSIMVLDYQPRVYYFYYLYLGMAIEKFKVFFESKTRELFMAVSKEYNYIKESTTLRPQAKVNELGKILFDINLDTFLSFLSLILSYSEFSKGYVSYEYSISHLIRLYGSIDRETISATNDYDNIGEMIRKLRIDIDTGYLS